VRGRLSERPHEVRKDLMTGERRVSLVQLFKMGDIYMNRKAYASTGILQPHI